MKAVDYFLPVDKCQFCKVDRMNTGEPCFTCDNDVTLMAFTEPCTSEDYKSCVFNKETDGTGRSKKVKPEA